MPRATALGMRTSRSALTVRFATHWLRRANCATHAPTPRVAPRTIVATPLALRRCLDRRRRRGRPPFPAEAPRPLRALLFADAERRGAALAQRLAHGGMQTALVGAQPIDGADSGAIDPHLLASRRDGCDALLLHLDWPLDRLVPLLVALRQRSSAPIALLREQGDDEDDVAALEAGFDAAWQSAIDDRVLWARFARWCAAPGASPAPPPALAVGRLRVDLQAAVAAVDGRLLRLTRTHFELLACLAAQPGIRREPQRAAARPRRRARPGPACARPRLGAIAAAPASRRGRRRRAHRRGAAARLPSRRHAALAPAVPRLLRPAAAARGSRLDRAQRPLRRTR